MANLNVHPAPGLGDLTTGFFVVPQDPITMANEGISRVPSLGEFLDASFVVPQNPLRAQITGTVAPIGQGVAGMPIHRRGYRRNSGMGVSASRYPDDYDRTLNNYPGVGTSLPFGGLAGVGCGGGSDCGCGCGGGLGTIATDLTQLQSDIAAGNYTTALSDTIAGIPAWVYGAALVALFMMNSKRSGTGR